MDAEAPSRSIIDHLRGAWRHAARFALDIALPNLKNPTKAELEKAMRGHVLDEATLMGTYQKQGKASHR